MLRESNSVRGDDALTFAKDLHRVCFECIGFVFKCEVTTFMSLFELCSSLLSELLPQIAGTFWLDDAAPDWRLKTEVTDEIIQLHVDQITRDVRNFHKFETLVNMSTALMNSWKGKYEHLREFKIYKDLTKLHGFHATIHEKMTGILKIIKPRMKSMVKHLQRMHENGRRVTTKHEVLLLRLKNI